MELELKVAALHRLIAMFPCYLGPGRLAVERCGCLTHALYYTICAATMSLEHIT